MTSRDYSRAHKIRKRISAGRATDIERAWLARYLAKSRPYALGPASVTPDAVLAEVAAQCSATLSELRGARGYAGIQRARAVAVVAMRFAGITLAVISRKLRRSETAVSHTYQRMHGRQDIAGLARAALERLSAPAPAAGDVITIQVVVGSRLWRALDMIEEMHELSDQALTRRLRGDLVSRHTG